MALPLAITVIVLALLIVLLAAYIAHLHATQRAKELEMYRNFEERAKEQARFHRSEMTAANKMIRELTVVAQTQQVDQSEVLGLIANTVQQVTDSVTSGMRSIYGQPINHAPDQQITASGDPGPIPLDNDKPDYSDPTDFVSGMRADGAEYAGNVIADDDPTPFGIPGLGIDDLTSVGG